MALARVAFIAVPPGREPGFDHADVSRTNRRMYVAHTGADRVDVLDCEEHAYLHALEGLPGVAGVLIDGEDDLLFTSDRGCARVSIFRCSSEELLGQVAVGPHPNGLAYDRKRGRLYAFNLGDPPGDGCTASVVDTASMRVVTGFDLPGRPRWSVYDRDRDRVYVNIRDPAEISVIAAEETAIVGSLPVPAEGPHGLWLDEGRLYCAADGGELIVLDRDDGQMLGRLPLPGVPDVIMHDSRSRRLYVAIGSPGVVCSFDSDALGHVETIPTEEGAHTICFDPVGSSLYVFCPGSGGAGVYTER